MINVNKWNTVEYITPLSTLQINSIKDSLSLLWKDVFFKLENKQLFRIQFKLRLKNTGYISVSHIQIFNNEDLDTAIEIFNEFWSIKEDNYAQLEVEKIVYTYFIIDDESSIKERRVLRSHKRLKAEPFKIMGYSLPNTMDLSAWDDVLFSSDYKEAWIAKNKSKAEYYVKLNDNSLDVELRLNNSLLLSFTDTAKDTRNLTSFTRKLNNQTYIFEDGDLKLKMIERKCKMFTKTKKAIHLSDKIITMDIETRTINGLMKPITISLFDGKNLWSYFVNDFESDNKMIEEALKSLFKRRYQGYKVYLHNFSDFDSIFIMKYLCNLSSQCNVIMRDGKMIDLKIKAGKYNLSFRDSYLLLPASLASLSKSFSVESKGHFPFKFINQTSIPLDYIGVVPSQSYFNNMDDNQYFEYSKVFNNNWNLKEQSIKYCEQDVRSLHQVLTIFNKTIFDLHRLDMLKYPTLSSLAFAIFRSDNKLSNNIAKITGKTYNDIKNSYTGGHVDVYIPRGENVIRHDVNSLYPFVMNNYPMPVGSPTFFQGDIMEINKEAFGFFNVDIIAPHDLQVPLLQTKVRTKNGGVRTIAGLGSWTGMYFSEELKKAKSIGYKIKVLSGYLFEKEYIFTNYVSSLYALKTESDRSSPMYTVAKLLLNSLYGRFGMAPVVENHMIIDDEDLDKFSLKFDITDVKDFENGKNLISYFEKESTKFIDSDAREDRLNINVAIASAITAYARTYMYDFKTLAGYKLFYSDTDSIDLDKALPDTFLSEKKLGLFKIEKHFKRVVYLGPKIYGGIIEGDKEVVKVKGLKETLPFTQLESLVKKGSSLKVKQDKWYSDIEKGNILIKEELYSLVSTANKRKMIYDKSDNLTATKPLTLKDKVIQE